MYDIDTIDTQEHSVTATVCENARLFGATPERGEFDCGVDRLAPELRDAFEQMRDDAAEHYRAETGGVWRPCCGSHTSQTGHLTSAAIDARDFLRARARSSPSRAARKCATPAPSSASSTRPARTPCRSAKPRGH